MTFKSHSSVAPSSGLFKVKVKDTLDGDSAAAVTAVGSYLAELENTGLERQACSRFLEL